MKKYNRLISHLAFPIEYSIISINRPTTNEDANGSNSLWSLDSDI